MTLERAAAAYDAACASMSRLNRRAAALMHVHAAHAATDVTGFGLIGHAGNLARHTVPSNAVSSSGDATASGSSNVDLELHTIPVIAGMKAADEANSHGFKLAMVRSKPWSVSKGYCIRVSAAGTIGGNFRRFANCAASRPR
jgi:selenide,water dikinase